LLNNQPETRRLQALELVQKGWKQKDMAETLPSAGAGRSGFKAR
jgi:transcriptional regulator